MNGTNDKDSTPLWSPSADAVAASNMVAFMSLVNERHGVSLGGYDELHAWSVANPALFWDAIWDFTGVIGKKGNITRIQADEVVLLGTGSLGSSRLAN